MAARSLIHRSVRGIYTSDPALGGKPMLDIAREINLEAIQRYHKGLPNKSGTLSVHHAALDRYSLSDLHALADLEHHQELRRAAMRAGQHSMMVGAMATAPAKIRAQHKRIVDMIVDNSPAILDSYYEQTGDLRGAARAFVNDRLARRTGDAFQGSREDHQAAIKKQLGVTERKIALADKNAISWDDI